MAASVLQLDNIMNSGNCQRIYISQNLGLGSNLWLQITVEIIQSWVAVQMTQGLTISFLWRQISTFKHPDDNVKLEKYLKLVLLV